jgi:hypothetical protein
MSPFKPGDRVRLIKPNVMTHRNHRSKTRGLLIPVGTLGIVRAVRERVKPEGMLVQFDGHGNYRHTSFDEVEHV